MFIFGFLSIFGFLLLIVFIIIFFSISVIGGVLRTIFGLGKKTTSQPGGGPAKDKKGKGAVYDAQKRHKKVFDQNEGEYVEFEEVDEKKGKK